MSHCFRFFLFTPLLACGPLLTPSERFHIEIVSVTPRELIQSVENVDVEFKLPGDCKNLRISVPLEGNVYGIHRITNGGVTVPYDKKGKDTYVAHIPTLVLAGQDNACFADEKAPEDIRFDLEAYCYSSADRATASWWDIGEIKYAAAWRNGFSGSTKAIAPSGDAPDFVSLGSGGLYSSAAGQSIDAPVQTGVTPLLVEHGGIVRTWGGCPFAEAGCGRSNPISLERADGSMAGTFDLGATYIYFSKVEPERLKSLTNPVAVPAGVVAIGFDSNSNKTVLINGETAPVIVTQIDENFAVSSRAFDGEQTMTQFSKLANGQLVFVTQLQSNPSSARLRKPDGTVMAEISLPGDGTVKLVSIAPSSTESPIIAMVRNDKFWLRSSGGDWKSIDSNFVTQVDAEPRKDWPPRKWGISWLSSAVALWSKDGVEVFELNGSLRYRYSRPLTAYEKEQNGSLSLDPKPVQGVVGVGDKAVVTFDNEVHLLDKSGHLKGGAIPLPCGSYSGTSAALAGEKAAVSAGDNILIFDLSRY